MGGLPKTYGSGGGGTLIQSGLYAAIPAAGVADRYYWATDIFTLFRDTGAAWEVVGAQFYERYIENIFGRGTRITIAVGAGNDDRVHYTPFQVKRTCTIDAIGLEYDAGLTTENVTVALYDSAGELPVNRLGLSLSTAILGASQKQQFALTVAVQLVPGYYFAAFICDTVATPAFLHLGDDLLFRLPAGVAHGPACYHEDLGAYGNPPAVATPVASAYLHQFYMWLRALSIP